MAVPYYGDFAEDDTVLIPFNTFSSDDPSASVTVTDLADADIKVYKDGGDTEIATDGATVAINFDTTTGNHLVTIDTSAHSDYATGSEYAVRLNGITVDGATLNAWIGAFSIERAGGALARLETLIATVGAAGIGLTAITDNTDEIGALGIGLTTCATATGFATPTNITAGTITTVSGNVNGSVATCAAATVSAINDIDLSATMKASITAAVWDYASALTLDFGTLLERAYQLLNNEMNITDATGVSALRNIADSADIASGSITDAGGTTSRAGWTWV